MSFDGVNSRVITDYNEIIYSNNQTHSMFAWVYPLNLTTTQGIISFGEYNDTNFNSGLGLAGNNVSWFHNGISAPTNSSLSIESNEWFFIGFVRNSTHLIFVVNNQTEHVATSYGGKIECDPFLIGSTARNGVLEGYFNGSIDEVMVFNRSLSVSEIQSLYNASGYIYENNFTNLSDGNYTIKSYSVDEAGNLNSTEERTIFVNTGNAIAIDFSDNLSSQIEWNLQTLPVSNLSALGNNNEGNTSFWINISNIGGGVDVYLKANFDLMSIGEDILELGNETYSYSSENASVPSTEKFSITTNYADNKIGSNLGDESVIYLKFFLSAPASQPAGVYNNTILVKAVPYGQAP
jgi:hypothetical protein